MALLIVDLDKHIGNAKAWRDTFAEQLPDLVSVRKVHESFESVTGWGLSGSNRL